MGASVDDEQEIDGDAEDDKDGDDDWIDGDEREDEDGEVETPLLGLFHPPFSQHLQQTQVLQKDHHHPHHGPIIIIIIIFNVTLVILNIQGHGCIMIEIFLVLLISTTFPIIHSENANL